LTFWLLQVAAVAAVDTKGVAAEPAVIVLLQEHLEVVHLLNPLFL
jgi:hypothetical protein